MKNNAYVDALISKFPTVSKTARKPIVTVLLFTSSSKGDSLLKSITTDRTLEKEVRAYAKEIMAYSKLTKNQQGYVKMVGKENLNEFRSASLKRFSDEAIGELNFDDQSNAE